MAKNPKAKAIFLATDHLISECGFTPKQITESLAKVDVSQTPARVDVRARRENGWQNFHLNVNLETEAVSIVYQGPVEKDDE